MARVTDDLMIIASKNTLMLFDISNKTLISTLKCASDIFTIQKINSHFFVVDERRKISLVTVIDNNKLVSTVILDKKSY